MYFEMRRKEEYDRLWSESRPEYHYLAQIVRKIDQILDSGWFRKKPLNAEIKDFLLKFETEEKPAEQSESKPRRHKRAKIQAPRRYTTFENTGITIVETELSEQARIAGATSKAMWLQYHKIEETPQSKDSEL